MNEEDTLDGILAKISVGERVNAHTGEWHVSNTNNPALIDMIFRQDAVYGFQISETDECIQFYNHHREARKGSGSESLKGLEWAFDGLAQVRNKPVWVVFDPFGQEDTERWLIKNEYAKEDDRIYVKRFEPKKPIYAFKCGEVEYGGESWELANPEVIESGKIEINHGDRIKIEKRGFVVCGFGGGIGDCPEGYYWDTYFLAEQKSWIGMAMELNREFKERRARTSRYKLGKRYELVETGRISPITSNPTYELKLLDDGERK